MKSKSSRLLNGLAIFAAAFLAGMTPAVSAPQADLLIRGGLIVDGTGFAPYIGDVAVRGDRIVAMGSLDGWEARRIIDAGGLHVAPGFIDAHSHAEDGLRDPARSRAHPLLAQGITTAVINPDGGGPVDLQRQREQMESAGIGVNVVQLIGHNRVRLTAMRGSFVRPPHDAELDRMKDLVRTAMETGAFGLSSGLFYTPGSYSRTDEVIALAKVVAEYDGVHSSHIRDESDYDIGVVASVEEIIDISRQSGVAGVVTHIKALGPNVWGKSKTIVETIARARAHGIEVWADQYPYHASATGMIAALVPAWARAGGDGGLRGRLDNPEQAPRIRSEMLENLARRGGADRLLFRSPNAIQGRLLSALAAERELEPVDAAIALIREGHSPGVISFNMQEEDIARFMRQPFTVTSTDGGLPAMGSGQPHPRTYGAFARKLRKYVREEGVLDLPAAIAQMSGTTAQIFRLEDRGTLRPGMAADIVIFDLERVNDPAGFEDPHQLSQGMVYVWVNGVAAIDQGAFTDATAGQVLRHRGRADRCQTWCPRSAKSEPLK